MNIVLIVGLNFFFDLSDVVYTQVVYITYNMGNRDLPDIYAHTLRPATLGLGHIYQANPSCPCYNLYIHIYIYIIIIFVTLFWKTNHVVTFSISRNTHFKYSMGCSSPMVQYSHARPTTLSSLVI